MAVRSTLLLICLMRVCIPAQGGDDPRFEQRALRGIEMVYNLEFESADSVFRSLIAERPGHPAGHFFLAMVDWWRIMVDRDNTSYDERFLEGLERVVDLCDDILDRNEDDVTALFFKGGALGFTGRLNFLRDDWFGAAGAGRKALPLVQTAFEADTSNYDIYLGTGIYNYYAAVIPERYPIAKPLLLFIPPGDKALGIAQLETAARRGKYAVVEAKYFLMQLNMLYERNYGAALALALELTERFPNNMLFHRYLGRCYVMMANYPMARGVFQEIVRRGMEGMPGYDIKTDREAEYYLGLSALHTRSYATGIEHLTRSDSLSREIDRDGPSAFMVQANLQLGKIYDAQQRRDLAIRQYRKVLGMTDHQDSHAQAEQFLETPFRH